MDTACVHAAGDYLLPIPFVLAFCEESLHLLLELQCGCCSINRERPRLEACAQHADALERWPHDVVEAHEREPHVDDAARFDPALGQGQAIRHLTTPGGEVDAASRVQPNPLSDKSLELADREVLHEAVESDHAMHWRTNLHTSWWWSIDRVQCT